MNKFYIKCMVCLFTGLVLSCSKAEKKLFDGPSGIYFSLNKLKIDTTLILRQDTIVYTFAYESEDVKEKALYIPVEITGGSVELARKYHIKVEAAENTHVGVDYEPVLNVAVLPGGKMTDSLCIMFKRNVSMQNQIKKLNIGIVSGGDFVEGVMEKLFVSVRVSDILEKPDWWDKWEAGFGSWHPTKLREWIKLWGGKGELPTNGWISWTVYPKECITIMKLKEVFEQKEFYDEKGRRLYIPANI